MQREGAACAQTARREQPLPGPSDTFHSANTSCAQTACLVSASILQLFTTSLPQKWDHLLLAPHASSLLTAVACRQGLLQLLGLRSGHEGHSCPVTRLGRRRRRSDSSYRPRAASAQPPLPMTKLSGCALQSVCSPWRQTAPACSGGRAQPQAPQVQQTRCLAALRASMPHQQLRGRLQGAQPITPSSAALPLGIN